jgi:hypothetical protein
MTPLNDDIYWASKSPEVNALRSLAPDAREAPASELAAKGVLIDRCIDIWGWDPTKVMAYRVSLGVTSQLTAFAPLKSIKVSIDAADYPPFSPAPPPLPKVEPVGAYTGNGLYQATSACFDGNGHLMFSDGQPYTQDGVTYIFHVTQFWGMPSINWSKQ